MNGRDVNDECSTCVFDFDLASDRCCACMHDPIMVRRLRRKSDRRHGRANETERFVDKWNALGMSNPMSMNDFAKAYADCKAADKAEGIECDINDAEEEARCHRQEFLCGKRELIHPMSCVSIEVDWPWDEDDGNVPEEQDMEEDTMGELKECPFCGKQEVRIVVYDDDGNERGELGCDYESDPWNGLAYGLRHNKDTDCIISLDGGPMGGWLYDTAEVAAKAWNERNCAQYGREK